MPQKSGLPLTLARDLGSGRQTHRLQFVTVVYKLRKTSYQCWL